MLSRGSNARISGISVRSPISSLMIAMLSTMASLYVAGRLWIDSENRVYLTKELDRVTGQGHSAISVDDTWKVIECREQMKTLTSLEEDLTAARQEGFAPKELADVNGNTKKRPLVVLGIFTGFGRNNNRDSIRKAWMSTGAALKKMEDEMGVIARFVIGRSSNQGESLDRNIDNENRETNDFFILEDHVEAPDQVSKKAKLFFAHAAEEWIADFYAKVNDDIFVNIDALGSTLAEYANKPRVYIGCMKSGEVFSEKGHKWHEPDWWKFGDGKRYFRHASGEMIVISRALAKHISINRSILRTYAHDDVTVGSWFIGADVRHVDDKKFCCSSWSTGSICSGV